MGIFSQVNCRNCGDGPEEPVDTKEALKWGEKHGKDEHNNPYQGLKFSNVKNKKN